MQLSNYTFRPKLWATLLTLAIVALFIQLSIWQYHRYHYKKALQETYAKEMIAPPQPLINVVQDLQVQVKGCELYTRISAQGHYDSHQFLLDNRIQNGQVGFEVITPLKLTNGQAILVDRGFVPATANRKILMDITPPTSDIQLTGLLTKPVKNFILGAVIETQLTHPTWPLMVMRVEPSTMALPLAYPLLPYIILLDANQSYGFDRQRPVPNLWAAQSLGYCFQWAAFAVTLIIIFVIMNLKRKSSHVQK